MAFFSKLTPKIALKQKLKTGNMNLVQFVTYNFFGQTFNANITP